MKMILHFAIALTFYSCDQSEMPEEDNHTECEKALDHIQECVGYKPYLRTCSVEDAEKILSTPCENIKELWR
jgi:hypothetical protein